MSKIDFNNFNKDEIYKPNDLAFHLNDFYHTEIFIKNILQNIKNKIKSLLKKFLKLDNKNLVIKIIYHNLINFLKAELILIKKSKILDIDVKSKYY